MRKQKRQWQQSRSWCVFVFSICLSPLSKPHRGALFGTSKIRSATCNATSLGFVAVICAGLGCNNKVAGFNIFGAGQGAGGVAGSPKSSPSLLPSSYLRLGKTTGVKPPVPVVASHHESDPEPGTRLVAAASCWTAMAALWNALLPLKKGPGKRLRTCTNGCLFPQP
jgi:hypothetical protein